MEEKLDKPEIKEDLAKEETFELILTNLEGQVIRTILGNIQLEEGTPLFNIYKMLLPYTRNIDITGINAINEIEKKCETVLTLLEIDPM